MLYTFLKNTITASISVFYRSIVVEGKENIPRNGPLIIAANHPNTFMDPLLIAAVVKQRVGFLANAGIFRNKMMAAVLSYLHVIPIIRKKDLRPGEDGDNAKFFNKSVNYLSNNGTFMIFPEGSSFYELKLREIKTGTARIAFQFQEQHNFNKGLKIMTVALNYSEAIKFRSKVMITFNPPIEIDHFKEEYKQDNELAIRSVTAKIEEELAEQLVIADTPEQENLLRQIQKLYAEYWMGNKRFKAKNKAEMEVRIALSRAISFFEEKRPEKYTEIKSKVESYFDRLDAHDVSQNFMSKQYFKGRLRLVYLYYLSGLILGLPVYVVGFFTHIIPVNISTFFSNIPSEIEYRAPVLMGVATFLIPLFYVLEIWLFQHYIQIIWLTILFALSLPICGAFIWIYKTIWQRFAKVRLYIRLRRKHPEYLKTLKKDRLEILDMLELARKDYSLHRKLL